MNANQEADYRRAISYLLLQGYKLKKLISVAKTMREEQQAGNEEHWADYDMGRGARPPGKHPIDYKGKPSF